MPERRPKASETRSRSPLLGKRLPFEEAFPDVADIRFEVKTVSKGSNFVDETRVFGKSTMPGEYLDCENPVCYGGGFSIGSIVRNMYHAQPRKTHYEGDEYCLGFEGSPKGRKRDRSCLSHWKVKVDIAYKP